MIDMGWHKIVQGSDVAADGLVKLLRCLFAGLTSAHAAGKGWAQCRVVAVVVMQHPYA